MIYFIGNGDKTVVRMQLLRSRLLENSRDMLSLFKKRLEMAKEVGAVKRSIEKSFRDRERELHVLENLDITDPIEERFLNLLFELTIHAESMEENKLASISLRSTDQLQELLAKTLCSPGDSIFMLSHADIPFVRTAVMLGAHIIEEKCDSYDISIFIHGKGGDSAISILNGNFDGGFAGTGNLQTPKKIWIEVKE